MDYYTGCQVRALHEAGAEANPEAIRETTGKLLEIAGREASAPLRQDGDGKTSAEVLAKKRESTGAGVAAKLGGEFFYGDCGEEELGKPKIVKAREIPRGVDGEKFKKMMERLKILGATIPGYRLKPGEDLRNQFQFPRFAMWLKSTTDHAMLNDPKSVGAGIYAGLPIGDRHRLYLRRLEQICDQSNSVVGRGWWCPK